ncbi:MAG TPA: universal stress protein [Methylomirabilota bacterium]|nr:universal stress protein [Methylomirabilota bacterium]
MNRKRSARLTVLLATDGSRQAHAALAFAGTVPWAGTATAHMVLARGGIPLGPWPADIWVAGISGAPDRALEREISRARRIVRHRWPDMTVSAMNTPPIEAIIAEARRRRAGVIVVGSRGLGFASRLMLGSVSRGVVRRARCPVLVVKGRHRRIKRLVLATDGSPNAGRALGFLLARLEPPAGARVKVVRVLEPVLPRTRVLLPAPIRRAIMSSAASLNAKRARQARREVASAAVLLKRAGWRARGIVREGVPLAEVLREATASRADLLVVGARGTGGLARLLLGSVAEGALDRSPVPVLLVK